MVSNPEESKHADLRNWTLTESEKIRINDQIEDFVERVSPSQQIMDAI